MHIEKCTLYMHYISELSRSGWTIRDKTIREVDY